MFVTAVKGSTYYHEKYNANAEKDAAGVSSSFMEYVENADELGKNEDKSVGKSNIFDRLEAEAAGNTAPYIELADENGVIEYNGAAFVCDIDSNAITLGDCSAGANVLTISLPDSGGVLKVNRDNIGQLMNALSMFSPRDRWAIIRAVSTDSYCERVKAQIEEESDSEFTAVETGGYSITQDSKSGYIRIHDKKADSGIVVRSAEDIVIQKDADTGIKMLINDFGNGFYCAIQVTDELEEALKEALGTQELQETGMKGFQIHTDKKTGIQYMTADGYESRGGSLILDDEDRKKLMDLANTYLTDYPELVSNLDEAITYAAFEVMGIAKRTEHGFMMPDPNSAGNDVAVTEEDVTSQRIVVKADGSRVLMMTIQIGAVQTSMSVELTQKASNTESSSDFEFDFKKEQAAEKYERHLKG